MSEFVLELIDLPWDIRSYLAEHYLEKDLLNIACCSKDYYACFKDLLWKKVYIQWTSLKLDHILPNNLQENLKYTTSLHLCHNEVPVLWGEVALNYTIVLRYCNSLTMLRVDNVLKDEGICMICKILQNLQELTLENCISLTVIGWEQLADIHNLKKLCIKNCFIRNSGIEMLTHIKKLQEFHLNIYWDDNVYITPLAFKHITKINHLKKLTLSCTNELSFTPNSLGWLSVLSNLEELSLQETLLDDCALAFISRHATNLKRFNIKGCFTLSDHALNELKNLISLEELNIGLIPFSETAIEEYCKVSGMKEMAHCSRVLTKCQRFWTNNGSLSS